MKFLTRFCSLLKFINTLVSVKLVLIPSEFFNCFYRYSRFRTTGYTIHCYYFLPFSVGNSFGYNLMLIPRERLYCTLWLDWFFHCNIKDIFIRPFSLHFWAWFATRHYSILKIWHCTKIKKELVVNICGLIRAQKHRQNMIH